ncbi:hypothetical protein BSLG_010440 [Batrachochytrium salamandrivorans]|nr:hypothetical protein BSLG_010440 [Batrachochytrium salamandrivorans]
MGDREFQNMFIFSTGFEAAALKVPMPGELDEQTGQLKRQIIGFAKFRSRSEAVKARDVLNGRRIDLDRGAILKAEIAKKNLKNFSTKRQPSLLDTALFGAFDPSMSHQGSLLSADALSGLSMGDMPLSSTLSTTGHMLMHDGVGGASSRFDLGPINHAHTSVGGAASNGGGSSSSNGEESSLPCPAGISINGVRRSSAAMAASLSTDDKLSPFPDIFDATTRASFLGSFTSSNTTANNNNSSSSHTHSHPQSYHSSFPIDVPSDYHDIFDPIPAASSSSIFGTSASSAFQGERGFNSILYNSESLLTGRFQNFHLGDNLNSNALGNNGSSALGSSNNNNVHGNGSVHGHIHASQVDRSGVQSQYNYSSSFPGSLTNGSATVPFISGMDQNPPCNTLYVGNLPHDASEEELRQIFSVQPGFKRLCFRTRANGPMCFVEFESVDYATAALFQLYGNHLSNSTKGGIRLSYSKNPLGVRQSRPAVAPGMMGTGIGGPAGLGGYISSTLSSALPTAIPAISGGGGLGVHDYRHVH